MAEQHFTITETSAGWINLEKLRAELLASGCSVTGVRWTDPFTRTDITVVISEEVPRERLLAVIKAHGKTTLSQRQEQKRSIIDQRTRVLIDAGFEYPAASGQFFSLSPEAQAALASLHTRRLSLSYPVRFNTVDDAAAVSLPDAVALDAFHAASVAAIRSARDGGTTLKDQVRAATTVAEVDAVQDNR